MPSLHEILHNRSIQWPGRPSQPIDMEQVRNFLISHKQAQCDQFNKAHGVWGLTELPPGQEVLFKSQTGNEYIPGTITEKATAPHSYYIEAKGKKYCRTRKHVWPIHYNLPPTQQSADPPRQQCFARPYPLAHKQQFFPGPSALPHSLKAISRPSPPTSHIPRPEKGNPCLARPSVLAGPPLPHHLGKLPSHILQPPSVNKGTTVFPSEEDLLHMSALVPLPNVSAKEETRMPEKPSSVPTTPSTPREELEAEILDSLDSQTVLPCTHFAPGCLSPTMRQPSAVYKGDHRLSHATTCPYLSPVTVSAVQIDTDGNTTDGTDNPDGSPAEVEADSSYQEIESLTAGTDTDMPTQQDVQLTPPNVSEMIPIMRKMPLHRYHRFPQGTDHYKITKHAFQDHPVLLTGPSNPHKELSCLQDHLVCQHRPWNLQIGCPVCELSL